MPTLSLAALDGTSGFTVNGGVTLDSLGRSVSSVGDVNGDGFDDVAIGADGAGAAGTAFVLFGKPTAFNPVFDLSTLNGTTGFAVTGSANGAGAGFAVSAAGDVNDDGFDDLLIHSQGTSDTHLVFGNAGGFSGALDLATFNSGLGYVMPNSGTPLAPAGDVNGDGSADFFVDTKLVFGGTSILSDLDAVDGVDGSIDLGQVASFGGSHGYTFTGAGGGFGDAVGAAGDVNGDGYDDVVIGAPTAGSNGQAYVFLGGTKRLQTLDASDAGGIDGDLDVAQLDGDTGFIVNGFYSNGRVGQSVAAAGDINGDGIDDLVIGAHYADPGPGANDNSGQVYVIFGKNSGFAPTLNLAGLVGGNGDGVAFNGVFGSYGSRAGYSVSSAGDIDGDGFDDLLIGGPRSSPNGIYSGSAYVVFGDSALPTVTELSTLDGHIGFAIEGIAVGDGFNQQVSGAGDINGDGFGDVMIGARRADPNGDDSGQAYIILGGDFTNAATQTGDVAANTLNGTANKDVLIGAQGDDLQVGAGGLDVLIGGQGSDVLAVSDSDLNGAAEFTRVVGGNGTDTLRLDGTGITLDLTSTGDNRIVNVEQIDIVGSGANTLVAGRLDVLNISDETNTLTVVANAGDAVVLFDGGWQQQAAGGGFDSYVNGAAVVKVTEGTTTTLIASPVVELADLIESAGNEGFVFEGTDANDKSGAAVNTAGDMNGDGFIDIFIGQQTPACPGVCNPPPAGIVPGEATVVFGGPADMASFNLPTLDNADGNPDAVIDLSQVPTPNGASGYVFQGVMPGDVTGSAISTIGDLNGDSIPELLIGSHLAFLGPVPPVDNLSAGKVYLVFGGAANLASLDGSDGNADGVIDLAEVRNLHPSTMQPRGYEFQGSDSFDRLGASVSAGDLNGDGIDDLLLSAVGGGLIGSGGANETYVVFGGMANLDALDQANVADRIIEIDELDAQNGESGFILHGIPSDNFSESQVARLGDVNGDSIDDLLVGFSGVDPSGQQDTGEAYVVFGSQTPFGKSLDLASLSASQGFRLQGGAAMDAFGASISGGGGGDVNGDGLRDLIIGAPGVDLANPAMADAGTAYVVFGTDQTFPANLAALDGTNGFAILGLETGDAAGSSVSIVGDWNGDGFDDVLIGAANADPNLAADSGQSYVIFGGPTFAAEFDLATLDGTNGRAINGINSGDKSGSSVAGAGDIDGDGFDDVLIGAGSADANGASNSGQAYVLFGDDFAGNATQIGGAANDSFTGTSTPQTFIGGRGDDALVGGGGADVLRAGHGNDTLTVTDISFRRIDGGMGVDTFVLNAAGVDLDVDPRLSGIEQIDITGSGDNTLTITALEVVGLSAETDTLIVIGDSGDVLNFGVGWTLSGADSIGNAPFNVFTKDAATVKVSAAVFAIPTTVALSALLPADGGNGGTGFTLFGAAAGDYSGMSVNSAGDVNGDGFEDVIVGSPKANNSTGTSHVVFGKPAGFSPTLELSSLNGSNGFTVPGLDAGDQAGHSVNGAGDVNGDGIDDLIIGAPFASAAGNALTKAGETYVVFGKTDWTGTPTFDLSTLDGTNGFVLFGTRGNPNNAAEREQSGFAVSGVGDVNGDGFADVIVGAPMEGEATSRSYIVFGKSDWTSTPSLQLNTLNGLIGFEITGATDTQSDDQIGFAVAGTGDINGDGVDDLVIGSYHNHTGGTTHNNASYVVFGKLDWSGTPTMEAHDFNGTEGFIVFGENTDAAGRSVRSAGDVNGDGFDDLVIGAARAKPGNVTLAGRSMVVFGKSDFSGTPTIVPNDLNGTTGFRINGVKMFDYSGTSVSSAGDFNGDGFDDLLVSSPLADPDNKSLAGESYVLFGKATGFSAEIDPSTLNGADGFTLTGVDAGDNSGLSVSSAGDVNGDGFDDLIIGSQVADADGNAKADAGESYVIFGRPTSLAGTQIGTAAANTLTGTAAADILIGAQGNDLLAGAGGADVLRGGQGDDVITIIDSSFNRIVGGRGFDTLLLDTSGQYFDLTGIADNRILSIEHINIVGQSPNTLVLSTMDLINLSDQTNTLQITGDEDDQVYLIGDDWSSAGTETVNGQVRNVFTGSGATIKVADAAPAEITNNPTPTVRLSVDNANIAEAAGVATFTATLSAVAAQNVTVDLQYTGTATLTDDFTRSATQIVITAGSLTGTATVTAVQDSSRESDETVIVDIASVTNGTESGTQQATTTITDDDSIAQILVSPASLNVDESGTMATFTVRLDLVPDSNVILDITSSDVGEVTVSPSTLTFTSSNSSVEQTVTVTGQPDAEIADGNVPVDVNVAVNVNASHASYGSVDAETVNVINRSHRSFSAVVLNGRGRVTDYVDVVTTNGNEDHDIELRDANGVVLSPGIAGRISLAGYAAGTYHVWVNDDPANYDLTESGGFGSATGEPATPALDLDDDGEFLFGSDGILLLAYALGARGTDLEPFRATGNSRSGAQIQLAVEQLADSLDLDGDAAFRFSNDGILLLAYALGTTGNDLGPFRGGGATRSGTQVESRLDGLFSTETTGTRLQTPDAVSVGFIEPSQPRDLAILTLTGEKQLVRETREPARSLPDGELRGARHVAAPTNELDRVDVVVIGNNANPAKNESDWNVDEFFSAADELADRLLDF